MTPAVAEALAAWERIAPATGPDDFILPVAFIHWGGGRKDRFDVRRGLDRKTAWYLWKDLERCHGLKHLPSVFLRHWVKKTLRDLSDPALAAWKGHKVAKDAGMRFAYDTPQVDEILAEQREKFPDGPMGVLRPRVVVDAEAANVAHTFAAEIQALKDYRAGRLTLMELASVVERAAMKARQAPVTVGR